MTQTASRRSNFKQADATRALRAAQKAGLKPSGYRIDPSGAIIVMLNDSAPASHATGNPWDDELMP
ncbi:MAG: hypothetical protein IPG54_13875 [Sphingomonadales bacterium]|jgi:hypothetical protein|nr:hypothetical protein [Sphingomonadales bacterium]MBK9004935.1 hypothetical protein [Sphingomonadales bacterium]MBK9267332.1 hypothetical protein [Sphingomonadales bacterium]MBP6434687.1 hypothetical protein [Sphingorhabdus sp.]